MAKLRCAQPGGHGNPNIGSGTVIGGRSVGLATDADGHRVMEKAVQDGCCQHLVTEDVAPLAVDQGNLYSLNEARLIAWRS